jgi:hypothetical protein
LTRYDTDTISREREFFRRDFFSAEAEKTIVAWQHDILSRAKSNPALCTNWSADQVASLFYKREREVFLSEIL